MTTRRQARPMARPAEPPASTPVQDADARRSEITSGGGAHDITGGEAAAHIDGDPTGVDVGAADPTSAAVAHEVAAADHGLAHGTDDATHALVGHGNEGGLDEHEERALGPVDLRAWGASILGVGVAVLVAVFLYLGIT